MLCPQCGKENKNTNIKCEYCGYELINGEEIKNDATKASIKMVKRFVKIIFGAFCLPLLIIGVVFLIIGIKENMAEVTQAKDYVETTGHLKNFINCKVDDGTEVCEAIYEYQVDGKTYTASPKMTGTRNAFKKEKTILYNPNRPQENVIYAGYGIFIIVGLCLIMAAIAIIFSKRKIIKRLEQVEEQNLVNIN